jgi:tetratricopeptide (TPR) repeat protein
MRKSKYWIARPDPILFLFLVFFSCQAQSLPVVGIDPVTEITVVEDHSEVLVDWIKKGYRDMVLVNIDQHDDLRLISEARIKRLIALAEGKSRDEIIRAGRMGDRSLYTLADFIYAAYRLGIVRKLYWVATSGLLEAGDSLEGARMFLRAFGYPEDVISTFQRDGDAVTGSIFGLEVTISSIGNLPAIREPVLLTVDVDYFPNLMLKKKAGELQALKNFFSNLKSKKLRVRHLSIAYSVNGAYTPVTDRHIGDELVSLFKAPGILDKSVPSLWEIKDRGFGYIRGGDYSAALAVFEDALVSYKEEDDMLLGKAVSLSLAGDDRDAFNVIESLIVRAPEYDYVYLYLAKKLDDKGHPERARRYIEAYLKRHPDSYDALMAYGDSFYNAGDDETALRVYADISANGEYISPIMYSGDALVHLGRYQEAMNYYNKGMLLMKEVGYRSLRNFPESARNMKILQSRGY